MDEAAAGFGTMWASMASWFTPTILFGVLNLVIGTIFMASRFKTGGRHHQPDGNEPHARPQLGRSPSLLERLTSINVSLYNFDPPETLHRNGGGEQNPPPQLARAPSFLERLRSVNLSFKNSDPSETLQRNGGDGQNPLPQLARGPSFLERLRSVGLSFKNSDPPETLRPAEAGAETNPPLADHQVTRSQSETTRREAAEASPARMRKSASEKPRAAMVGARGPATESAEDEGVDARADDFINRFKQQLKLQRLDSFLRYREMLNRGTGP